MAPETFSFKQETNVELPTSSVQRRMKNKKPMPEISSLDQCLLFLDHALPEEPPEQRMKMIAETVRETFGAVIWFAEIFDPRWSYIAGMNEMPPDFGDVQKILLGGGLGLVSASFGSMTAEQETAFIEWLRRQVFPWTGR